MRYHGEHDLETTHLLLRLPDLHRWSAVLAGSDGLRNDLLPGWDRSMVGV